MLKNNLLLVTPIDNYYNQDPHENANETNENFLHFSNPNFEQENVENLKPEFFEIFQNKKIHNYSANQNSIENGCYPEDFPAESNSSFKNLPYNCSYYDAIKSNYDCNSFYSENQNSQGAYELLKFQQNQKYQNQQRRKNTFPENLKYEKNDPNYSNCCFKSHINARNFPNSKIDKKNSYTENEFFLPKNHNFDLQKKLGLIQNLNNNQNYFYTKKNHEIQQEKASYESVGISFSDKSTTDEIIILSDLKNLIINKKPNIDINMYSKIQTRNNDFDLLKLNNQNYFKHNFNLKNNQNLNFNLDNSKKFYPKNFFSKNENNSFIKNNFDNSNKETFDSTNQNFSTKQEDDLNNLKNHDSLNKPSSNNKDILSINKNVEINNNNECNDIKSIERKISEFLDENNNVNSFSSEKCENSSFEKEYEKIEKIKITEKFKINWIKYIDIFKKFSLNNYKETILNPPVSFSQKKNNADAESNSKKISQKKEKTNKSKNYYNYFNNKSDNINSKKKKANKSKNKTKRLKETTFGNQNSNTLNNANYSYISGFDNSNFFYNSYSNNQKENILNDFNSFNNNYFNSRKNKYVPSILTNDVFSTNKENTLKPFNYSGDLSQLSSNFNIALNDNNVYLSNKLITMSGNLPDINNIFTSLSEVEEENHIQEQSNNCNNVNFINNHINNNFNSKEFNNENVFMNELNNNYFDSNIPKNKKKTNKKNKSKNHQTVNNQDFIKYANFSNNNNNNNNNFNNFNSNPFQNYIANNHLEYKDYLLMQQNYINSYNNFHNYNNNFIPKNFDLKCNQETNYFDLKKQENYTINGNFEDSSKIFLKNNNNEFRNYKDSSKDINDLNMRMKS